MNWFSGGSGDRVRGRAAELVVDDLAHVADDRVLVLVALEPVVAEQAVDVVLAAAAADVVVAERAGALLDGPRGDVAANHVGRRVRGARGLGVRPVGGGERAGAGARHRQPGAGGTRVAVDEGVVARDDVVLGVALDHVVAVDEVERAVGVGDRAGREAGVAVGRRQDHVQVAGVRGGAADDVVLALAAEGVVGALVALDVVLAGLAQERVAGRGRCGTAGRQVGQVVVVVVAVRRLLRAGERARARPAGRRSGSSAGPAMPDSVP